MHHSKLTSFLASTLIGGMTLSACVMEEDLSGSLADNYTSFDEFLADAYQEPDTGIYVVDGDMPFENVEQLREYYDHLGLGQNLIVHQANGGDASWSDAQKQNLSYCVSTSFGGNYNTVVNAMANAAADWEFQTDIDFVHDSSQDGNCNAANGNVIFDVRPVDTTAYLARAFFPNYARSSRNVLIANNAIGGSGVWSLRGILRHELGHVLGFRHEHTRPQSGTCYEDSNYRDLTEYDAASVMHYPHCNGSQGGDLVITTADANGAIALYGPAPRYAIRTWDGSHYLMAQNAGGAGLDAPVTAINDWETFHINHLGGGQYAIRSYNGHYVVAESNGAANANRTAVGPWERFAKIDTGNGMVAFRSIAHARYLVAEGAGGGAVNANRTGIGPWEQFAIVPIAPRCGSEQVSFIGGPYASMQNGVFDVTRYYNGAPVYQHSRNGTWSIYKRDNGYWYLDFNAVSEDWDGTVAHTNSPSASPWTASWTAGAASPSATVQVSGAVYPQYSAGTYNLVSDYQGSSVYQHATSGWYLYKRGNGAWHIDFNAVSEDWDGTVAYSNAAATPWQASWDGATVVNPGCSY